LFLVAGWWLAWAYRELDLNPHFGIIYLLVYGMLVVILFGLQIAMMPDVLGAIGTWATALGNLGAAIGMLAFLRRRHPGSLARLSAVWDE
jgi:hypothetical protein